MRTLPAAAAALALHACGQTTSSLPAQNGGGSNAASSTGSCYAAPSHTVSAGGGITIAGSVRYEDRTYDAAGFTGTACLPVRNAAVELVSGGAVVQTAATDAAGGYSFTVAAAGSYYVRTLAQSGAVYNTVVKDDRDQSTYAVRSDAVTVAAGEAWTVPLSAGITGAGPAFNIYDNVLKAQGVLQQYSGSQAVPLLTAYWYDGKASGTYYSYVGGGHTLDILGSASDSDAYDDTVLLHETGHYAAAVYSKDSSGGGAHSLSGHYDIRLTWSEGWATFFSSMVRAELGEPNPQVYVDTTGGAGTGSSTLSLAFEIDTPSYGSLATGADNEMAVANVLWTIYAAGAAPHLGLGFADIWADVTGPLKSDTYVSLEGFYDHWVAAAGHPAGQLDPILAARIIKYLPDAFEADNNASAAHAIAVGASQDHTFFAAGDADWFSVAVTGGTQYTFYTHSLGDGADTLMTLYDTNGTTQLDQNDDESASSRASRVVYAPTASKTVYLKLEPYRPLVNGVDIAYGTSAVWPPQIVKYGYYTLTVQ